MTYKMALYALYRWLLKLDTGYHIIEDIVLTKSNIKKYEIFCLLYLLKVTTILMTIGFPVTISIILSTLELKKEEKRERSITAS